jgi:hypothetical protein
MDLPGAADQGLVEAAKLDKIQGGEDSNDKADSDQGVHGQSLQSSWVYART